MTFHVPVCVDILRVVFFVAADLDLFESPLRQDHIGSFKVTPEVYMLEPQPGRQRVDFFKVTFASSLDIVHDLNLPMVLHIANSFISVTRHLVVEFGDGSWNWVGVQVSRCR